MHFLTPEKTRWELETAFQLFSTEAAGDQVPVATCVAQQ